MVLRSTPSRERPRHTLSGQVAEARKDTGNQRQAMKTRAYGNGAFEHVSQRRGHRSRTMECLVNQVGLREDDGSPQPP